MRTIFADTSALYALLDRDDRFHRRAVACFDQLAPEATRLVCSSYVLLETISLLQARLGMESIRMWRSDFEPILHVVWVDSQLHGKALTALVAANQRGISLTDWTSFELMREQAIEEAFAFDPHFAQQGFRSIP